ncbi:MAG: iron-sulfur cluster assembly accessory protein [Candidatus Heimdallarchaeota archaeon]|nr:iron-sulfur cluster assembly accessory protein [Candidatus Heimdallarchaeota archaeon]
MNYMDSDQLPLNKSMASPVVEDTDGPFVTISETAMFQVKEVIKAQNKDDLFLRLYVQSSVTGISFGMALDSRKSDEDHQCEVENLEVRIDKISYPYLKNATVDFVQSDEKTGFQITSPNTDLLAQAAASCGSCSGDAGCC